MPVAKCHNHLHWEIYKSKEIPNYIVQWNFSLDINIILVAFHKCSNQQQSILPVAATVHYFFSFPFSALAFTKGEVKNLQSNGSFYNLAFTFPKVSLLLSWLTVRSHLFFLSQDLHRGRVKPLWSYCSIYIFIHVKTGQRLAFQTGNSNSGYVCPGVLKLTTRHLFQSSLQRHHSASRKYMNWILQMKGIAYSVHLAESLSPHFVGMCSLPSQPTDATQA